LLMTVAFTTVCWVLTALFGPETDRETLVAFYRKVRPFGPGWRPIQLAAGVSDADVAGEHENVPLALIGWASGCSAIWSALFTVGNFLYGRNVYAAILAVTFLISAAILTWAINKIWG
jgi:SSS family solute:Na+ symporter